MADEPPPSASRKRKLPSSLGLGPGGRSQVASNRSQPAAKKQATATKNVRADRLASAVPVTLGTIALPSPPIDLSSPPQPASSSSRVPVVVSPSPPRLVPSDSLHLAVPSSSSNDLQFTRSSSPPPTIRPLTVRPLPAPFSSLPIARPFPLLDLPMDVLSVMSSYFWVWDSFFVRCTCKTLRMVSGLSGGVNALPVNTSTTSTSAVISQQQRDSTLEDTRLKRRLSSKGSIRKSLSLSQPNSDSISHSQETQSIDGGSSQPSEAAVSAAASSSVSFSLPPSLSIPPTLPLAGDSMDLTQDIPSAAAPSSFLPHVEDQLDDHRFWHHYTSLDLRQLLNGWRVFEETRRKFVADTINPDSMDLDPSPSPIASPTANTITIFDSDEENPRVNSSRSSGGKEAAMEFPASIDIDETEEEPTFQMRGSVRKGRKSNSGTAAAASNSVSIHVTSEWKISIYQRLQRVVAPFLNGHPRIRSVHLSGSSSSTSAAEDVSTSSEDDVWLLHFLHTHRLPFVQHVHFGYTTLHSSLIQHLQSFCCGVGMDSAEGNVRELTVQHSEKSVARSIDTLLKGFGKLEIVQLDLSTSSRPPTSIMTSLATHASTLTRLTLIGPTGRAVSLGASILDLLSTSLPQLRHCSIAHGLQTSQLHLQQAARAILIHNRWNRLRSLTLIHFPEIEHLAPLIHAFEGRSSLRKLDVQGCVNLRLPVIELPKVKKPASTKKGATAKGQRSDSPPPTAKAPTKQTQDISIPLAEAPRLPTITSCTFHQCGSITASSIRSLGIMFPKLESLQLSGFESKTMGGSALKLLMDPILCPYLTSLNLSSCPHLDDHAWESLPKKTRMTNLRSLNLSLSRAAAQQVQQNVRAGKNQSAVVEGMKFTDYGLRMVLVYCPNLSSLNLSGHIHLTPATTLKIFRTLLYIETVMLTHQNLDSSWLISLASSPIAHACTVHVTLTPVLLRSSSIFLDPMTSTTAATIRSAIETPTLLRLPSKLTSATSNGALLRMILVQRIQDRMATITQGRITLIVHT